MKTILSVAMLLFCLSASAQWTGWGLGLLQQPNALAGRFYIGVTNFSAGTNIVMYYNPVTRTMVINATGGGGGGGGSGTVTSFSSGNLTPLFTTSVATSTTTPSLSFSLSSQGANTVLSGPTVGGSAAPSFRSLVASDIPSLTLSKISDAGTVAGINLSGDSNEFLNGVGGWSPISSAGNFVRNVSGVVTNLDIWWDVGTSTGLRIFDQNTGNQVMGSSNPLGPPMLWFPNIAINESLIFSSTNDPSGIAADGSLWLRTDATDRTNFLWGTIAGSWVPLLTDSGGGGGGGLDSLGTSGDSGISLITSSNAPIAELKSVTSGSNITIEDQGTNLVFATPDAIRVITNSGAGISLVESSGSHGAGMKSISSGFNISLDDDGTNVVIHSVGDSGGTDLNLQALVPEGGSNTWIDFSVPMWQWAGTGAIAFRYSTNWPGGTSTGRVTQVYFPRQSLVRSVYMFDQTTNWNTAGFVSPMIIPGGTAALLKARVGPPGETNVFASMVLENRQVFNQEVTFNPASVPGLVLWLDAAQGIFEDITGTNPVTSNDAIVKRWEDQSPEGNHVTNNVSTILWNQFGAPSSRPSVKWPGGNAATGFWGEKIVTYAQPFYIFTVVRQAPNVLAGTTLLAGTNVNNSEFSLRLNSGSTSPGIGIQDGGIFRLSAATNDIMDTWLGATWIVDGSSSVVITNSVRGETVTVGSGRSIRRIGIGNSSFTGTGGSWQGEVAELIVYSANLSGQNLTNVQNYLQTKYGIP